MDRNPQNTQKEAKKFFFVQRHTKMGSAQEISKMKYFSPILHAVARILLIFIPRHLKENFAFCESLAFTWYPCEATVFESIGRPENLG